MADRGGCQKGMRGCALSCGHRAMVQVQDYWAAREADVGALEAATALYPAEVAAYRAEHPAITFQQMADRPWTAGLNRVDQARVMRLAEAILGPDDLRALTPLEREEFMWAARLEWDRASTEHG